MLYLKHFPIKFHMLFFCLLSLPHRVGRSFSYQKSLNAGWKRAHNQTVIFLFISLFHHTLLINLKAPVMAVLCVRMLIS